MGKTLKRSLIVGIIALFLSTSCLPVLASEGKPDLIIESMGFLLYDKPLTYATVKNVGDAEAFGTIYLKCSFTRMFFNTFSCIDTVWTIPRVVEPGDHFVFHLIYEDELPKFGFFTFKCSLHPELTIEESNSDNNDLIQNYIAISGHWIKI